MRIKTASALLGILIIALTSLPGQTQVVKKKHTLADELALLREENANLPKGNPKDYEAYPCALLEGNADTQAFYEVCARFRAKVGCLYPDQEGDLEKCGVQIRRPTPEELESINRSYAEAERLILHKLPVKKN